MRARTRRTDGQIGITDSDFPTRLEEARVAGPSSRLHSQLLDLHDLARAAGIEQHEFRAAMSNMR
jgi:hypothetical protein